MENSQYSLQVKLTASFIFLISLISVGVFILTFGYTKQALKETVREELKEIAMIAGSQVSQDQMSELLSLKPGDEGSPKYMALVKHFVGMRSTSKDVGNFYVVRKDGNTVRFILDDFYPEENAAIDEEYSDVDRGLLDHWGEVSASDQFYTDKWGTFLSGYAPLKDQNGVVVAMLAVDMQADDVIAKQKFIDNTLYFILGFSILIAGLLVLLFSKTIIRDLQRLTEDAKKIEEGDLDLVIEIQRRDEIGELATTFNRMANSIRASRSVLEKRVLDRTSELEKAKASLEATVEERTLALQEKLAEVTKMNKFMIDRELAMIKLKREIAELRNHSDAGNKKDS
jgi:HAMP domain-containing protein